MSLKVWLPLNGNLDNKGCGVVKSISGTPLYKNGKTGAQALDLSSRVTFTFPCLANLSTFSVCFWAIVESSDSITGNWQDVIGFTDVSIEGKNGNFRWESGYNGAPGIHWHSNATNALVNGSVNHTRNYNEWCHCCVVFDNEHGKVYSYTNGVLVGTHTHAGGHFNSAGSFHLGETDKIEGRIEDVRFYDHALSAAEVHEIAQGLVLHYKLDGPMGGANDNYIVNGDASKDMTNWRGWATATNRTIETINGKKWFHFTASAGTSAYGGFYQDNATNPNQKPIKPNTYYTVSARMYASDITSVRFWFHMRSTEGGANIWQPLKGFTINSTPQIYSFTFNSGSNDNYTINRFNLMIGSVHETTIDHDVYFTDVKFEEGKKATDWTPNSNEIGVSDNIIYDSSGYGHNGEIINILSTSDDTPRYDVCTHFSDTNQKIKISNFPTSGFGNSYTFAWWAKISSATPMHWGFSDGIRLNGMYTGRLWNTGDSSNNPLYTPGTTTQVSTPTTGVWHHWTMTGDGTKCRVYQDGELWGEAKTYKAISGTTIYINGWDNGTNYSSNNYSISDFRIYATALSDQEILNLYNIRAKITNSNGIHSYSFKESGSRELLSGVLWTDGYTTRTNTPSVNVTDGEYVLIGKKTIETLFIPINPVGHEYYYDVEVSTDADNSFYIGFERYDADKTPRTNASTVYLSGLDGTKKERNHQRYRGTVNLSTDGVNPCAFIALRVLNDWYNPNGYKAIIHRISLREVSEPQTQLINKNGMFETDELVEGSKAAFFKDGLVEAEQFVEM